MIPAIPPSLSIQKIQEKVTELTSQYPILQEFPIDSEEFAEMDLGIEIIPVLGLRTRVDADAFITRDFASILIDNHYFNNPRMRTRNNFSIAHELGHLFLHRYYFESQCPSTTEDAWIEFMTSMSDVTHNRLEWQAHTFASLMLMPRVEYRKEIRKPNASMVSLGRAFGVSPKAAARRMNIEDVRFDLDIEY